MPAYYYIWICGATWIAHLASDQMVAGSNPVVPATAMGFGQFSKSAYVEAFGNIGKK